MSSEIAEHLVDLFLTYGGTTVDPDDGSPIDGPCGARLQICSECGDVWVLAIGVSRSWWCPRCSASRVSTTRCLCEHVYGEHATVRPKPAGTERDFGECTRCKCWWYRPALRRDENGVSGADR